MKHILKNLGFCLLWLVIDIGLLAVCHEVFDDQQFLEGIFRILSISAIAIIILKTKNNRNTSLIISLSLLYILFNIYRMTGMMELSYTVYDSTTAFLGLVCFFCILYVNATRLQKSITVLVLACAILLAYFPLYTLFLSLYFKQYEVKISNDYYLEKTEINQLPFKQYTQNKITVAALFNEDCAYCFMELKMLNKLRTELADTNIVFVAVHTIIKYDSLEVNKVKPYVPFPIYHDTGAILFKNLKREGIPQLLIYDNTGKIQFHTAGYDDGAEAYIMEELKVKIKEVSRLK